ncbi:MAG: CopD family protein [Aquificaceae bacterium]|nr:CopD family protein [Aquificaceae bacterium]MCS7277570.1 CopD family protein [Aquificaceae bacterium]MDW8066409.1 CopD family protein [Aquificaceae bacterium]MDW8423561.1 CopD family protein [Aquificaceae bacterium]
MIKSLLFFHLLFAILWIGGMIYSLLFLKPAVKALPQEDQRSRVLKGVFSRFFPAVWLAILILFITGMGLWHGYRKDFSQNPLFHAKLFLFALMTIIFAYIYFFLYRRDKLSQIPNLIAVNLLLGLLVLLIITYIT